MVVDGKGKIFENRRKLDERRKNTANATGGKRKTQRRKETNSDNKKA